MNTVYYQKTCIASHVEQAMLSEMYLNEVPKHVVIVRTSVALHRQAVMISDGGGSLFQKCCM